MIVLIILLVSGHFLISIAWIREKESMKKMISAEDFPAHGPWIVSVGDINYKIYFRKKKITDMVIPTSHNNTYNRRLRYQRRIHRKSTGKILNYSNE